MHRRRSQLDILQEGNELYVRGVFKTTAYEFICFHQSVHNEHESIPGRLIYMTDYPCDNLISWDMEEVKLFL